MVYTVHQKDFNRLMLPHFEIGSWKMEGAVSFHPTEALFDIIRWFLTRNPSGRRSCGIAGVG